MGRAIIPLLQLFRPVKNYNLNQTKHVHSSIWTFKWAIDRSKVPKIADEDLEEKFVKGSGPGGQSVNKTVNACFIRHIPTGLVVKCHESRSLDQNRRKARELLIDKLDQLYNGDNSIAAQIERRRKERSSKMEKKAEKKRELKKEWKEREGIS